MEGGGWLGGGGGVIIWGKGVEVMGKVEAWPGVEAMVLEMEELVSDRDGLSNESEGL